MSKRNKAMLEWIQSRGLELHEVMVMDSQERKAWGLPEIVPPVDYTPFQQFCDSYLPRWAAVRRITGLDKAPNVEPVFSPPEPYDGRIHSFLANNLALDMTRAGSYRLVEEMDNADVLVSSALDIYAEESTQPDIESGRSVWIESDDKKVADELNGLLVKLHMEDMIFGLARSIAKYGDSFEQAILSNIDGVINLLHAHPSRLTRCEDVNGIVQGFIPTLVEEPDIDPTKYHDVMAPPWKFVHFRLISSNRATKHGDSLLKAARRVWKILQLIEDSLCIYRLNRAADKDVYYIDVKGQATIQKWQAVHMFRKELRKNVVIDQAAAQLRQQNNPRTLDEDLYFPVVGKDDATRVERLQGAGEVGNILDVEYFRRKLFAALKIPAAFMGYEIDTNAKSTLTSQDVRFARTCKRLQKAIKSGIHRLCEIHFAWKFGQTGIKFKVRMSNVNHIEEMARVESMKLRYEVANMLLQLAMPIPSINPKTQAPIEKPSVIKNVDAWAAWVFRTFLGISNEDTEKFLGFSLDGDRDVPEHVRQGVVNRMQTNGGTDLKAKAKLLKEAMEVLKDTDYDEAFQPGPLPKKDSEKVVDDKFYDLDDEMQRLMEAMSKAEAGSMRCPECEAPLSKRYDRSISRHYLICTKCRAVVGRNNGT